jgi:outer membrane protein OmpA-like peptidoglycan-associated protein
VSALALLPLFHQPIPAQAQNRLDGPIGDVDPRMYDATMGPAALLGLDTTWVVPHFAFYGGLSFNLANDELVARQPNGEPVGPLRLRFISTLGLGLGIADALDLQVALPLHTTEEFVASGRETAIGLGDLKVTLRWRALSGDGGRGFGLALQAGLWLPTGGGANLSTDGEPVFEPRVIADYRLSDGVVIAGHLGYRIRPDTQVLNLAFGDELRFGAGVEVPVAALGAYEPLSILAEIEGAVGLGTGDFDPDDGISGRKVPIEARLGLRWRSPEWAVTVAGGTGLTDGYGTPDYRLLVTVGWSGAGSATPEPPPRPSTSAAATGPDGQPSSATPTFPPAPTLPIPGDAAPTPGAPDTTPSSDAAAALAAFDAVVANDPDPDNDGVAGAADQCPYVPEDLDGHMDQDGCPDPDNDGDGVLDAADKCPTELETPNGFEDEDGCPDIGEASVVAKDGVIELKQTIEFNSGSNVLAKSAAALLDQIAAVLKANPQVRRVRVEGHTDNQGDEEMNVDLSERRAERVRVELTKRGVERDRLLPRGFGSTRPIADNRTNAGRKANRRVEFRVIDPAPPGQPRIDFDTHNTPDQNDGAGRVGDAVTVESVREVTP